MSNVNWKEIALHLATQIGTVVALGAVASLTKVDWSVLGGYAPAAQAAVAMVTSIVNQALRVK